MTERVLGLGVEDGNGFFSLCSRVACSEDTPTCLWRMHLIAWRFDTASKADGMAMLRRTERPISYMYI